MAPKAKEKPKPSAPQPAVPIEDLFTSLKKHIDRSEYTQVVKVANQVLSIAPGDEDALRCKVVAQIQNDQVDEALETIRSSQKFPVDLHFFRAYCLYRQNKLDEALESLKSQESNKATMLLESQILYRLGRMDTCLEIYRKLQEKGIDSFEINFVAALVGSEKSAEVQKVLDTLRVKPTSSFELAYNTACSLIERNKFTDAEQLLLSARRVGQESLMEENWADDDIEQELAPVAVQLAYVQQLLGDNQAAMGAYLDLVKRNFADISTLAVATNNLIALRGPKDVSDSLKKIDRLLEKGDGVRFQLTPELEWKLSAKQKEAVYVNRALLLLHANRIDQARELVTALVGMFPSSFMPALLQAAVLVRENKAGKAEETLGQYAEKFPDSRKVFLLARAQVAASAGHAQVAADSLAKILDIQHMPATVATIVALKERAGDIDGAEAVFDDAIKWWSNAMTEDNKLTLIMKEAASFKLKHGRQRQALALFEDLLKSHNSVDALVGLVTTAAHVDVDKAEAYEKKLKPLPGLKGINVDDLEKTSGAKPVDNASRPVNIDGVDENKNKDKTKKKRKRKPRYPKGFDPANPGPPPDPERWLPKRERSTFRPKRKDKRAVNVRGSQGSVSRDKQDSGVADPASRAESSTGNTKTSQASTKTSQASSSKGSSQNAGGSKSKKKSRR